MNDKLKWIIKTVKSELSKEPSAIIIGKLGDSSKNEVLNDDLNLQPYYEFLRECNGARCGSIDLWSAEILLKNQYRVTEIPGGEDNWICIGQILYEPTVINKMDGKVYRFYQGHETDMPADCFGIFDEFLMRYVFGENYAEIIPDADEEEWYQFLKKINLL